MNNLNHNIYFLNHRRSYMFKNEENSLFSLNNAQSFNLRLGDFKNKKNWNDAFSFGYSIKSFKHPGLKYTFPTNMQSTVGLPSLQSLSCLSLTNQRQKYSSNNWGYIMSPRRGGFIINAGGFVGFMPKTHSSRLSFNYHFSNKKNYSFLSIVSKTSGSLAPLMFPCHLLSAQLEKPLRRNVKLSRFKYIFTSHSRRFLNEVEKRIDFIRSQRKNFRPTTQKKQFVPAMRKREFVFTTQRSEFLPTARKKELMPIARKKEFIPITGKKEFIPIAGKKEFLPVDKKLKTQDKTRRFNSNYDNKKSRKN